MRDTPTQTGPIVFGAFLERLKAMGFNIGVDDYLRVQQLLGQPDLLYGPAELKLLLCPLFATSEKQQKQFYEIFESFFTSAPAAGSQPEPVKHQTDAASTSEAALLPVRKNKWPVYSMAATGLILFVAFVWLVWPRTDPPPPPVDITYPPPPPPPPTPSKTPQIKT